MKTFAASLLAFVGVAHAAKAQQKNSFGPVYDGYFEIPDWRGHNYGLKYENPLPSADFNKQVYRFDED